MLENTKDIRYKVVIRSSENTFRSTNIRYINTKRSKYICKYEIGKTTVAPVGGVLLFDTLQRALAFRADIGTADVVILQGEAEGPVPLPRFRAITDSPRKFAKMWNKHFTLQSYSDVGYWPFGTCAYKKFTPLKIVM